MTIRQHIGMLEEELNKFSISIDVFSRKYLIDKIIEYTETINREAIRANEKVDLLYSEFNIPSTDILDGQDTPPLTWKGHILFPRILDTANGKEIMEITFGDYKASRVSLAAFNTLSGPNYRNKNIVVTIVSNGLMRAINVPVDFFELGQGDVPLHSLTLRAIWEDQRSLLSSGHTQEDELNMDLKVASSVKLQMLIKKDIFSSIGVKEDGNSDNKERTSQQ